MGLVAVCGNYDVVVELRFSVFEVEAHTAVVVVDYSFYGRGEEYVVWGKAFHYGVDVALGAVFEG